MGESFDDGEARCEARWTGTIRPGSRRRFISTESHFRPIVLQSAEAREDGYPMVSGTGIGESGTPGEERSVRCGDE